jgi:hypothetical protein
LIAALKALPHPKAETAAPQKVKALRQAKAEGAVPEPGRAKDHDT